MKLVMSMFFMLSTYPSQFAPCQAVECVHAAYLRAGADVLLTSSYMVSHELIEAVHQRVVALPLRTPRLGAHLSIFTLKCTQCAPDRPSGTAPLALPTRCPHIVKYALHVTALCCLVFPQ